MGYLFGWSQLAVIRPGDIALLAFVFARYARTILDPFEGNLLPYAGGAVVLFTIINVIGVRGGKWTQNVLTVIKVVGLLVIVVIALFAPAPKAGTGVTGDLSMGGLELALILVLFTFGGWNEMAYVAAEVRDPKRSIFRGLVIGTVVVTALYLLVNGAFLFALGYEAMSGSEAVATDAAATVFPHAASRLISLLICLSALGAVNGLIFTGARISYAIGVEHRLFRLLGRWNPRLGTPVWALAVQGALSFVIVLIAGSFINTILYTAPVVWLFFLATGISVFVLRRRDPNTPRPYRVSWIMPALFCTSCVFMLYSCLAYAISTKPLALIVLAGTILTGGITYGLGLLLKARPNNGTTAVPPEPSWQDDADSGTPALRSERPRQNV
jgi:amino acid transporter